MFRIKQRDFKFLLITLNNLWNRIKQSPYINRHKEPLSTIKLHFEKWKYNTLGDPVLVDCTEEVLKSNHKKSLVVWEKRYKKRGLTTAQIQKRLKEK